MDYAQLQPVKSEKLSKVFTLSNIIKLTKIYRQKDDSPVLDVLSVLREKFLNKFETKQGINDSLFVFNKPIDFLKASKEHLIETIKTQNVLNCKIVAYRNKRVNTYNQAARKLIFGNDFENEYNQYEILTGTCNFTYEGFEFFNSLDYIILEKPEKIEKILPNFDIPLNGYDLTLYDTVYKNTYKVFILSKNNKLDDLNALANTLENIRLKAVKLKQSGKPSSMMWSKYYQLEGSFATPFDLYYDNRIIKKKTFDYGYAITVHKSQGSSYNNIFVDISDINICSDPNVLRQLQYVSISRTKGNAYLLV